MDVNIDDEIERTMARVNARIQGRLANEPDATPLRVREIELAEWASEVDRTERDLHTVAHWFEPRA